MIQYFRTIGVLTVGVVVFLAGVPQDAHPDGPLPHPAITIARDTDFQGCACVTSGSGTPSDPYVIGPWLITHLGIVRVYTKAPGRPPDRDRPFTLRRGQTVEDVARLVHKDLAGTLQYARVWGTTGFGGQHVGREPRGGRRRRGRATYVTSSPIERHVRLRVPHCV